MLTQVIIQQSMKERISDMLNLSIKEQGKTME